jgi:hypothetical protein
MHSIEPKVDMCTIPESHFLALDPTIEPTSKKQAQATRGLTLGWPSRYINKLRILAEAYKKAAR